MSKISELIAAEKLDDAAEVLYDTLYNVLKVGNDITREDFAKVAPKLVEKLQSPAKTSEKTDAPGDDAEVVKYGVLKVTLKGKGLQTKTVNQKYVVDSTYKYTVPTVKGYTADKTELTGTMTEKGVEETVTYTVTKAADSSKDTAKDTSKDSGASSDTTKQN